MHKKNDKRWWSMHMKIIFDHWRLKICSSTILRFPLNLITCNILKNAFRQYNKVSSPYIICLIKIWCIMLKRLNKLYLQKWEAGFLFSCLRNFLNFLTNKSISWSSSDYVASTSLTDFPLFLVVAIKAPGSVAEDEVSLISPNSNSKALSS